MRVMLPKEPKSPQDRPFTRMVREYKQTLDKLKSIFKEKYKTVTKKQYQYFPNLFRANDLCLFRF